MRSTLVCLLMMAILSLCARASPLPLSARRSIPTSSSRSLLRKRTPGPGGLRKAGYELLDAAEKEEEEDWKRPVAITTSAIGLFMTFGWNYVAVQSYMANRAKHKAEQRRLEAEKNKPPPQVGDIICMVQTYYTQEQVEARNPTVTTMPCFRLGAGGQGLSPVGVPTRLPFTPASGNVQPTAQPMPSLPPVSFNPTGAVQSPSLVKRGIADTGSEIVEESMPMLHDLPASKPSSSSTWLEPHTDQQMPASEWIPLMPVEHTHHRLPPDREERMPMLSSLPSLHSDQWFPTSARLRPGFTHSPTRPLSSDDLGRESRLADSHEFDRAAVNERIARHKKEMDEIRGLDKKKKKRLKTADITFGITVLNTVGTIPSFILTTANAYYYRGNPKVD